MYDIKWIREHANIFDTGLKRRGLEPLSVLAKGKYSYNSAGKRKLSLKLTKKGRIAMKKTRKALLRLSSGESKVVRVR